MAAEVEEAWNRELSKGAAGVDETAVDFWPVFAV